MRVYDRGNETCNEESVNMVGGHRVGLGFRGESEGRQRQGMPSGKDLNGEGEAANTREKVTLQRNAWHLAHCQ